jgi:hypothetical protein
MYMAPMGTSFGVSWHGYAAYISGILVNIVGFAGAIGVNVPIGATVPGNPKRSVIDPIPLSAIQRLDVKEALTD